IVIPLADSQCGPVLSGHGHAFALLHRYDHRIALRSEIAAVFVALSDFELHGADPVYEGGFVERVRHGLDRRVAAGLTIESRIGVDVEFPLPRLALFLGLVQEPARAEVVTAYP